MFGCDCRVSLAGAVVLAAVVGGAGMVAGTQLAGGGVSGGAGGAEAGVVGASYQPEGQPSPEEMMEMMKEWAAPVEEHELLQKMVGEWDCATKFWMGPGDPMEGAGTSECQSVLDGRYVTQHVSMPDMMGMPFEGMGATGYDKAKGKYESIWIDNFSTGFMTMEGEYDKDAKTMTWTGTAVYPDGRGGTMDSPVKHVIHYAGKDKVVMEFWEPPAPGEDMVKSGEITYTRRK